jgi:DNA mismatch repair protein MutS2
MEFDEETGRPNYRLHPGLSGRSRALSVAREQGLPETVLRRSRDILGEAWRRREEREAEAEAAIERLRQSERELARERDAARREAEKLAKEREAGAAERARMLEEGLAGFERARRDLARRVEEEILAIRTDASRRAEASTERLIARAEAAASSEPVLTEAQEEALAKTRELAAGERARIRGSRTTGVVLSLDAEAAWLEVSGKRMRVPRANLEPLGGAEPSPEKKRGAVTASVPAGPEPVNETMMEINVIGQRIEDALPEIEKRLDEALLTGAGHLRIIHGHGTGRLRDAVRDHFRDHPSIASLRAGDAREGGNGATIVELA